MAGMTNGTPLAWGDPMFKHHRYSALIGLSALACTAPGGSAGSDPLDTVSSSLAAKEYVDARSYLTEGEDIDRWYELSLALTDDFDDICGDTFCEGDYSNYESLGFDCSVDRSTGRIGQCVWVFAASIEEIDPVTGSIDVHGQTWQCLMPITPETNVGQLLDALAASDERPLDAGLPGSEQSLYDGLVDCL
jgi:hypothetical protein